MINIIKFRKLKKYLSCFFVLILFSAATFSIAVGDDDISVIRVGCYENTPKIYTDKNGSVSGFWPTLLKHIAAEEGWEIQWVSGTWAQCLDRLKTGEINILPDTGWTEPRSQEYAFPNETVLVSWSRLYVPKNSKINSIIDLNGKTIAGLKGSFNLEGPEGLRQILHKFNLEATIKGMEDYEQVFEALQEGKIDAGITNKDSGNLHENDYAVERTSIIFQPARMQFAFTKNADMTPFLIEKIDAHIKRLKGDKNSIYYQALDQYIGGNPAKTFIEIIPEWVKITLAVGCGVILFLFVVGIASRRQVRQRTFELQESEQKLSTHLQNTPIGAIYWDLDFKTIEWNPAAEAIFGYSKTEAMGKHVTELILPEDIKELVDNVFQDLLSEKGGVRSTNENITRDGRRIICDWYNTTLKDINGKVIGVASLVNDITERKQSEIALISSEHKWRNILVNIPQIGITLDTKAKITFANAYFLQLTGWKEQKVIGQDWFDMFIPERVREEVREVFLTVMSQKDTIGFSTYENEIMDRSGMLMNVAWSNALTKDVQGNVIDVTCLGVDLTERQHSEQALKKSEEKYRSMMEAMKDGSYICSSDLHIEYMNPAMIDRVGHDATSEICHKAIYARDEKCSWCVFDQVKKGNHVDYEVVDPKENRHYSVTNSPISHTDGTVSKLTIFRDITEMKKMESQLQQAQKMEAIGTLAGGIAHDFNNILFPVIGHTELLLEDVPCDSPFKERLNQIYNSALRARDLVKQILTFSRQESSELMLMKMQPVVKEALKLIRSTIPATIEIKQDINPDCGVIKADPTQIHQIVMNLATNAYHAMEETGGVLKVSLKQMEFETLDLINPNMEPGVYACLTVADTGVGMGKNLTDKIFDPFFTTKSKGKGTGMGLSVVHGIVTAMGGVIHLYSEPGKGTQFHVYLPIEKGPFEEQNIQIKTPLQGGTEQILLVDDEEPILTMEKRMLTHLGYQVTTRASSVEALEAFGTNPDKFELIITDMQMPNMNGDKLSAELIKIRPDIPILLCTGFSENMSKEKAASLGIKGFILKPIVMNDLAQKIREVLDNNKNLAEN